MKAGSEHMVALSDRAVEIIKPRLEGKGPKDFLFPGRFGPARPIVAGNNFLRRLRTVSGVADVTSHGFRKTFVTWCVENDINPDLRFAAIAHARGSVSDRAYDPSNLLNQRRPVMDSWWRMCEGVQDKKVVQLRSA